MKTLKNSFLKADHKLDTRHPAAVQDECCCSGPDAQSECSAKAEKIRIKAYELYVGRGCQDCFDVQDWVKAEELCSKE